MRSPTCRQHARHVNAHARLLSSSAYNHFQATRHAGEQGCNQVARRGTYPHHAPALKLCESLSRTPLASGGGRRARLQLLQQLLALDHVPEHRVAPVQQVGAAGRQLRLLAHTTVCSMSYTVTIENPTS